MNTVVMILSILIALGIYGGFNYYAGRKLWKLTGAKMKRKGRLVFILVIVFFSISFILSNVLPAGTPEVIGNVLSDIGGTWLVFMLYFVMGSFVIDICKLILRKKISQRIYYVLSSIVLTFAVFLLILGRWNATHPIVVHDRADIPARLVVISDIHLGQMVNKDKLTEMVNRINDNKPDFVFFAGDTFDRSLQLYKDENMAEVLRKINSTYGTFAIFGNHEYYSGDAEDLVKGFEEGGVKVLRDQAVSIGGVNIIGRDDISVERLGGKRKTLDELMQGLDQNQPTIVLDHQPKELQEMRDKNITLGISGHTHGGQLFPLNIICSFIFPQSKGIETNGHTTTIVSTGYGLWGPIYRIGTRSEMIVIN